MVLAVYDPPYLDKAPITNAMFLDEVTDFLATFLVKHNNIIITGNFNIHVNNTNDPEPLLYRTEVAIPKPALKRQTITSCNIKDVVIEDLVKELDLGTIDGENINDLVNQLDNKYKTALETLAPETTKCVTI